MLEVNPTNRAAALHLRGVDLAGLEQGRCVVVVRGILVPCDKDERICRYRRVELLHGTGYLQGAPVGAGQTEWSRRGDESEYPYAEDSTKCALHPI